MAIRKFLQFQMAALVHIGTCRNRNIEDPLPPDTGDEKKDARGEQQHVTIPQPAEEETKII